MIAHIQGIKQISLKKYKKFFKKLLIFVFVFSIIIKRCDKQLVFLEHLEMSPRWSRAHDWKSCRGQKPLKSSNLFISATKPWNFVPRFFCFLTEKTAPEPVKNYIVDLWVEPCYYKKKT